MASSLVSRSLRPSLLRAARKTTTLPSATTPSSFFSTDSNDNNNNNNKRIALVIGSSGALGSAVSHYLSQQVGMHVLGADVIETPEMPLDGFISLATQSPSAASVTMELASGIHDMLEETEELDTIVVAAGGWAGDTRPMTGQQSLAEEIQMDATLYGSNIDTMIQMNLIPVIAAGYAAQRFMGPNGLFVTIGATAALSSTPGMMGYGLTKAAAHHIVQTVGATTGKSSLETKTKQKAGRHYRQYAANLDTLSAVAILPTTIDTPSNRHGMPQADFDSWTKPVDIAEQIGTWVTTPQLRPHSGALVKVTTMAGNSVFDLVR
ncbi:expressed unknown protein [Seminavis robusta]|uniref:Uncharacterized protein n=1 Tax=Seminavis robusta TaxID=568900 RepID=A0A9N8HHE2_9STRA|nr:expressed unknown protein [Seminavis robusta]|eukprot:Sro557_g166211.1  (321) ;mRNA; r:52608-53812